jgi:hypothetical protein
VRVLSIALLAANESRSEGPPSENAAPRLLLRVDLSTLLASARDSKAARKTPQRRLYRQTPPIRSNFFPADTTENIAAKRHAADTAAINPTAATQTEIGYTQLATNGFNTPSRAQQWIAN